MRWVTRAEPKKPKKARINAMRSARWVWINQMEIRGERFKAIYCASRITYREVLYQGMAA
jgi:hypothetical protein